MQKKLIVLAIAALASTSAFADSTVNVYGLIDAAIANVSGTGLQGGTTVVSNGLATSRFGVKATEDLDGGLKVVGVLEYAIDPQSSNAIGANSPSASTTESSTFGARQQLLALAGDFGTLATGFLQTTGWDFGSKYNVVAGSDVSPLGNLTKKSNFLIGDQAAANRAQRAIAYISPSLGGLVVAVNYSTALASYGDVSLLTTASAANTSATLVSADYTAGPLAVALVYAGLNADAYLTNRTEYAAGVAYTADVAKITATYQSSKLGNETGNAGNSISVYSVGAAVPVASVGSVVLSYAKQNIGTDATSSSNASSYSVGLLKPLSKTTTAYVAYSAVSQGTGTANVSVANDLVSTTAGGNSSLVALGLQKKF